MSSRLAIGILACSLAFATNTHAGPTKPNTPKPAKPPAAPRVKPPPHLAHNPVQTHARSLPHTVHHNYYAGRAARSRTWYHHHHHHHWVYEVRFRSRAWHERAFGTHASARTFMHYLATRHFSRHLHHPTDGLWVVTYRNPYHHHYGTYAHLPVAKRVEAGLRASGFYAWIRWHRRYYW